MAESRENLSVICRLGLALNRCNFPSFCLKPLQVKCFEYLLNGYDVIAVLPTGFGKSLLFQLLPDFLPVKADKNVVIVVCPLNSIIEDQLKVLGERGVTADVLQLASDDREGKVKRKVRSLPTENKAVLEELIFSELTEFEAHTSLPGEMLFSFSHEKNALQKIMEGIDYIETESDLLDDFKIWNETCSSKIFSFISKYAPLIEGNTSDT